MSVIIMTRELIYYKRIFYPYLKQEYESKGFEIYTFSQLSNSNKIEEIIEDENRKFVIDLSSTIPILTDSKILFDVERLLDFFPEDTVFISEVSDSNNDNYKLRYCFSEFNEYSTDRLIEDQNQAESMNIKKVTKITDFDSETLQDVFNKFNELLYGHDRFKKDFINLVNTFKIFNSIGEHEVLSIFLMGDSGVGKTEVARAIYKAMGGKNNLVKINFGNYSSSNALNSLIGSPRGFIGSESGELFDKVFNTDIGVILIDEFEKANTPVFNYFLEVLESGIATNSQGEEVNLSEYIFIFTSNIPQDKFSEYFSPELRSRFDYKGYFGPLSSAVKKQYLSDRLDKIIDKYNQSHGTKYNNKMKKKIFQNINVEMIHNLRDLNRVIRKEFTEHLDTN